MSMRIQNAQNNALKLTSEFKEYVGYVFEYKTLLISIDTRILEASRNN